MVNNNTLAVAFALSPHPPQSKPTHPCYTPTHRPFAAVIYGRSFHLQTGWEASGNRGSTLGPVLFTQPAETRAGKHRRRGQGVRFHYLSPSSRRAARRRPRNLRRGGRLSRSRHRVGSRRLTNERELRATALPADPRWNNRFTGAVFAGG